MGTTTIRVDTDTHARLLALSQTTEARRSSKRYAMPPKRSDGNASPIRSQPSSPNFGRTLRRGRPTSPKRMTRRCPMASVDDLWLVDFGDPHPGEPAAQGRSALSGVASILVRDRLIGSPSGRLVSGMPRGSNNRPLHVTSTYGLATRRALRHATRPQLPTADALPKACAPSRCGSPTCRAPEFAAEAHRQSVQQSPAATTPKPMIKPSSMP